MAAVTLTAGFATILMLRQRTMHRKFNSAERKLVQLNRSAPCCADDELRGDNGYDKDYEDQPWQHPEYMAGEQPNHLAHQIARDSRGLARHVTGHLQTKHIAAGKVEYSVVLPANFTKNRQHPYPLIVSLHPGGQSCKYLFDPEGAARTGRDVVPPRDLVWASFSNGRFGMYQNLADGTADWEQFFMNEFLPFIERTYACGGDRSRRYLTGICMGGLGVLKYAFKHSPHFAAAAAQQPAMPCGDDGTQLPLDDTMNFGSFRSLSWSPTSETLAENRRLYGAERATDTNPAFFREHISPIAMAIDHQDEIRASGLRIFLDCGDQDRTRLHNAAELLHRMLWWLRIPHEYHLVAGADHMGSSWRRRGPAAMDFLFRAMTAELEPPEIISAEEKEWIEWKKTDERAADDQAKGGHPTKPEPAPPKHPISGHCVFSDKQGALKRAVQMAPLPGTGGRHELNGEAATVSGSSLDGPAVLMGHPWRMPRA